MGQSALASLAAYHPLVVEGSARHDRRDPALVAARVCAALREHWRHTPPDGPPVLVIQGDPLTATGISAITRRVASELGIPRCLVALDASIDPEHRQLADVEGVTMELRFLELAAVLRAESALEPLEQAIDAALASKSREAEARGGRPLASYYRDYALLQEVTKAACRRHCGRGLTVAHTAALVDIKPTSVTSFFEVGLALELYGREDVVAFDGGGGGDG